MVGPSSSCTSKKDRQPDKELPDIAAGISSVPQDVRAAVRDWSEMRRKLNEVIASLDLAGAGSEGLRVRAERFAGVLGMDAGEQFHILRDSGV